MTNWDWTLVKQNTDTSATTMVVRTRMFSGVPATRRSLWHRVVDEGRRHVDVYRRKHRLIARQDWAAAKKTASR